VVYAFLVAYSEIIDPGSQVEKDPECLKSPTLSAVSVSADHTGTQSGRVAPLRSKREGHRKAENVSVRLRSRRIRALDRV